MFAHNFHFQQEFVRYMVEIKLKQFSQGGNFLFDLTFRYYFLHLRFQNFKISQNQRFNSVISILCRILQIFTRFYKIYYAAA